MLLSTDFLKDGKAQWQYCTKSEKILLVFAKLLEELNGNFKVESLDLMKNSCVKDNLRHINFHLL